MNNQNSRAWYRELKKPTWAPPPYLFGPVWSVLYILIAISFGYTAYQSATGNMPLFLLLPFALNLLFNVLFTPIQFGLKSNELGMLDIYLVLITLIEHGCGLPLYCMGYVYKHPVPTLGLLCHRSSNYGYLFQSGKALDGRRIVTVVPWSKVLSMAIVPEFSSTMRLTIASPRPHPS